MTEETGTQLERETQTIGPGDTGSIDEVLSDTTQTMEETIEGLFPNTPAPDKPVPTPQAHRTRVTGVVEKTWPSGDPYIAVGLHSLENASELEFIINTPKSFSSNVTVDPATLSTEETTNANGKTVPSERAQFARSVRNSGKKSDRGGFYPNTSLYVEAGGTVPGDGTIETLARLANEQGHTIQAQMPRTFTQLTAYLNALTTGTEVVGLLRAQGGDSEYSDRLKVQRIVSFEYANQETTLKDYRKLWNPNE